MPLTLNRRDVLRTTSAALVLACCKATTDPTVAAAASGKSMPGDPAVTLRDACRAVGIRHGAARDHLIDPEDPDLDRLMARECDILTAENGGKWAVFQPEEGRFDWRRFDLSMDLARRIGAQPNWHTAIWQHMGMPPYMKLPAERRAEFPSQEDGYFSEQGTLSPDNYWQRFTDMVAAVKARYGDSFYRIDVANEMFFWETAESHPHEQDRYGFRKGMWWVVAGGEKGPDWLDPFFHHIRREFPKAKLVLNEFGIELDEGWQQRKRAALLTWLTDARARGVPIDGLGLQSHLIAGKPHDHSGMRDFLRAVDRLGLPIHITEFDVSEHRLPQSWSRAEKDNFNAKLASDYLRTVMSNSQLVELCWWHLRSDLNYISRQYSWLKPHPSPYDANSRPLPLYASVVRTIQSKGRS
jgi:endo-1,4-beta-xylanase